MKSADISDGKNFAGFFAPKAKLLLRTWRDGKLTRVSFTKEVAKAAVKSCVGPLSFDEGRNWVQLSWVCQVNEASPLAEFITFRESSEFALTVWFKNGKIVEGDAGEPLPVPGQRFVPMNAFDQMKARG